MINFQKICQTKTKPVVRAYIYWLWGMYAMSDEKKIVAELSHRYKEIRCTFVVLYFGGMGLAKGLFAAVDEPGILFFKSHCLSNER